MNKIIISVCIVGSALIFADSIDIAHWFVLFLLAGIIPGTDIALSPVDMMAAFATAMTVIILRVTVWSRVRPFFFSSPELAPQRHKRTARRTA